MHYRGKDCKGGLFFLPVLTMRSTPADRVVAARMEPENILVQEQVIAVANDVCRFAGLAVSRLALRKGVGRSLVNGSNVLWRRV